MIQCPRCGGSAEPDPEHAAVMRCLSCWDAWTLPSDRHCSGVGRGAFAPGLRALEAHRDLNC